ncbi:MAG: CoA-binding protein [Chloroflexi bacterium]|nr:CoA-binding protein [Chloroflexota bacterium]
MNRLFHPRSIAIVGASAKPMSPVARLFLSPLLGFGFPGLIYPINPNATEIMGLKTYPNLKAIPGPVDYVICAVSRKLAAQVVQDSVDIGAGVVTLFTSGFSESGTEDCRLEEKRIVDIARRGGVRLIGPKCLGVHRPEAGISLEGLIPHESGRISYLCQSGGNAQDFILAAAERRIFLRKLVSFGNAADLNESDFLEHFAEDEGTEIIAVYVEGVKEPRRFAEALRQAGRRKPVIMLKGGKGKAGVETAASHTGALAGSWLVWDSLCRQAECIQVKNLEELVDCSTALAYLKPPRGRRVGIVNMGGGSSVLAADEFEDAGLEMPPYPLEVVQEMTRLIPGVGMGFRNPIDSSSELFFDPVLLGKAIEIVGRWDGVDLVVVCVPAVGGVKTTAEIYRQAVAGVVQGSQKTDKPLAVVLRKGRLGSGEKLVYEVQDDCFRAGLPVFGSFGSAARAIGRYVSYYERSGRGVIAI